MKSLELTKKGKYLAYILRHNPNAANLTIEDGGWVDVNELIENTDITLEELEYIVINDDKKRYSFDDNGRKIRANQGHSITVNINFKEKIPPKYLYHGTAINHLDSINKEGLTKQKRHHVHLSHTPENALNVGRRHGVPIILRIDSEKMYNDGYKFYISENNVWLVDKVPTKYFMIYEIL
jgi:putative RNA 2'-phosphotransferase